MSDEARHPVKTEPSDVEAGINRLEPLIPLAETFLSNYNRQLEISMQVQQKQLEVDEMQSQRTFQYDEKYLEFEKSKMDKRRMD